MPSNSTLEDFETGRENGPKAAASSHHHLANHHHGSCTCHVLLQMARSDDKKGLFSNTVSFLEMQNVKNSLFFITVLPVRLQLGIWSFSCINNAVHLLVVLFCVGDHQNDHNCAALAKKIHV